MDNKSVSNRFSFFLACIYSNLAFVAAFLPMYCRSLGHTDNQIAFLSSVSILASMIMGPILIEIAHRAISPRKQLRILSVTSVFLYLPLFFVDNFYYFLALSILWFLSSNGLMSLFDTYIVRETSLRGIRYEVPRAWGSIGYVIYSLVIGVLYDLTGTESIIYFGLACPILTLMASYLVAPCVDAIPIERADNSTAQTLSLRPYLPILLILIIIGICQWVAHGPLFVFFSLYLQHLGASGTEISAAWMVMVVAEILFFFKYSALEKHLSLINILRISLLATIIRWIILYYSQDLFLIFISQTLHAFSYVGVALSSIKLVSKALPKELSARGQGILASLAMAFGAFLGRFLSGYGMEYVGDISKFNELFIIAIILSLIAFFVSFTLRHATSKLRLT